MKRKLSALIAATLMIATLAGCNETSAEEESSVTNGASYETWNDIDRDTVIAYVEGADSEKFDITFGEFYSEYLYYLLSYNIADDMDATYKEACETYREDIITYLTFERLFLEVAEEMGCGISSLTDEEKEIIKSNTETTTDNFISNYTALAAEELGEDATEDDILNRSTEMLVEDLARAELTTEIFEKWETNNYVQEKLLNVLTADIEVTEADVEAMFNDYVEMAKAALEADKLRYEIDSTLTWVSVPECTRLDDQLLVMFDEETKTAIN